MNWFSVLIEIVVGIFAVLLFLLLLGGVLLITIGFPLAVTAGVIVLIIVLVKKNKKPQEVQPKEEKVEENKVEDVESKELE